MKRLLGIVALAGGAYLLLRRLGYEVTIGGVMWDREGLERMQSAGPRKWIVVGGCLVQRGVAPELLSAAVESLTVVGGLLLDRAQYEALSGRVNVIGGANLRSENSP